MVVPKAVYVQDEPSIFIGQTERAEMKNLINEQSNLKQANSERLPKYTIDCVQRKISYF